jgi:hypothetical protein
MNQRLMKILAAAGKVLCFAALLLRVGSVLDAILLRPIATQEPIAVGRSKPGVRSFILNGGNLARHAE